MTFAIGRRLAELQGALKRSDKGINLTFLKNILVRYMRDDDLDNSLPVIAQALEFSAREVNEIRESRQRGLRGVGRTLRGLLS